MENLLYEPKISRTNAYNVWMAFPGITSFSLSSLGFLWIYKLLDEDENINVERICTDTKVTNINFENIQSIGFSFSFDLDFINIFKIMEKYNIPFKAVERNKEHPLIFGGGPVLTSNPTPYQDIFDYIIVGDGEELNKKAITICSENKNLSKSEILKILSKVEGIYVPTISTNVKKATCNIPQCIYTPILSENSFFKNTFIVEISRGCSNHCGFCIASYLNIPVRFASYENIIETLELGLKHTNKLALLGAQVTAHPRFKDICEYIYKKIQNDTQIEMSISSLRVDAVEPNVIKTLVAAGQKHLTIAIEAGSERLRKIINKNISEEQIMNTVKTAQENKLKGLKIYAMLGIPTETQDDLKELVTLAKKIKTSFKNFEISFSFSSFVPKPQTPLQWCGRDSIKILEKKQNYLKKEFHKLGIKSNFSSIKWDYFQAVLSRGDSTFTDYIVDIYKNGANLGAFKTCSKGKFNTDDYATRNYNLDEELPWDCISIKPNKERLIKEYQRLLG